MQDFQLNKFGAKMSCERCLALNSVARTLEYMNESLTKENLAYRADVVALGKDRVELTDRVSYLEAELQRAKQRIAFLESDRSRSE